MTAATVVSILLYGCTTWMLTKHREKKLDINYTRMLRVILRPGGSAPQSSSCTATNHPSRKLSKLDEPDMRDTAGAHKWCTPVNPFTKTSKSRDNQPEPTYNSSVPIWDIASKTCWKQWTIGRGSKRDIHADGATWWWWWTLLISKGFFQSKLIYEGSSTHEWEGDELYL